MPLPRATTLAHQIVSSHVPAGGLAVDATAGNGHDTEFLARLVGPSGKVHAFDVQELALASARARLTFAGLDRRVTWHQAGHEEMERHVEGKADVVMFNLGYLPGGDHALTTRAQTTVAACRAAARLLGESGLLSLVMYRGHPGGAEEAQAVIEWAQSLDSGGWSMARYEPLQPQRLAPSLLLVSRGSRLA